MNTPERTSSPSKFQLRLNWRLLAFSLLMLPLLLSLGLWQLQRAEQKQAIQDSWEQQQTLPPAGLGELSPDRDNHYRRVRVQGSFDTEHYWLVENRVLDGQLGYEVLMPFLPKATAVAKDAVIIVNRGWVPAGAYRSELPEITTPRGIVEISGVLVTPSHNRLMQGAPAAATQWPGRVLQADLESFGQQLKSAGFEESLYPYLLQIDPSSVAAFTTNWQPINTSPSKHTGYAVQWFTMAFVLVVLTLLANTNLADVILKRKPNA